jgi:DNA repair protein RecN (Recombination protein N)
MLALKSLDSGSDSPIAGHQLAETLVFDEIDAGIGGATATVVAERLRQLASRHQLILITHLAQIAAIADRHYVVSKQDVDGQTQTLISEVSGDARVAEIARMLSGSTDEVALQHAQTLLKAGQ